MRFFWNTPSTNDVHAANEITNPTWTAQRTSARERKSVLTTHTNTYNQIEKSGIVHNVKLNIRIWFIKNFQKIWHNDSHWTCMCADDLGHNSHPLPSSLFLSIQQRRHCRPDSYGRTWFYRIVANLYSFLLRFHFSISLVALLLCSPFALPSCFAKSFNWYVCMQSSKFNSPMCKLGNFGE